jgi:hypothetical protein
LQFVEEKIDQLFVFMGIYPLVGIRNHRRIRSLKPEEIKAIIREVNVTDVFFVNSIVKKGLNLLMLPGGFSAASDSYDHCRLPWNRKYLGIPGDDGELAFQGFLLLGDNKA